MISPSQEFQLLYEEPRKNHLKRKWAFIAFVFVPFMVLLRIFGGPLDGLTFLLLVLFCFINVFTAVRLGFSRKRFRIFSDRLVLSSPRRVLPSLRTLWNGEVIWKRDVQLARFNVLSRDGEEFATKVPGRPNSGMSGDWRLELILKNDEKYQWDRRDLLEADETSRKNGRMAIEKFLDGVSREHANIQAPERRSVTGSPKHREVNLAKSIETMEAMAFIVVGIVTLGIGGFFLWTIIQVSLESNQPPITNMALALLWAVFILSIGAGSVVVGHRRLKRMQFMRKERSKANLASGKEFGP